MTHGRTHPLPQHSWFQSNTARTHSQHPKAPIRSINSQVIQQPSGSANYIVQITLSCQPLTHVTHTHTHIHAPIVHGRCYLSLPPALGECQPQSTCGRRLITPVQMQNYDCFFLFFFPPLPTACKPRGGWNYISDAVIAGKLFVLHPVIPHEQRRRGRLVKGTHVDGDKVRYWWVKGAGDTLRLGMLFVLRRRKMNGACASVLAVKCDEFTPVPKLQDRLKIKRMCWIRMIVTNWNRSPLCTSLEWVILNFQFLWRL